MTQLATLKARPDEAATALVPLADCYIHRLNTRSEPPAADIEALALSIDDIGLLQNLAGWFDPATPGRVGIVAGGRRLRALLLLAAQQGRALDITNVPVKIAPDEDTARLWASAENTARTALHPADEVRAYGRMQREGYFADTIARAFAVTERHVKQRLKLAALPDIALAALREGKISLDQAAALTMAPSSDVAAEVLQHVLRPDAARWESDAAYIRRRLEQSSIDADDRRVKLVGLDAYREAGGEVQEDLFTEQVRLLDEALLDELVQRRMSDAVDDHLAKGWKWAEIRPESEAYYRITNTMQRLFRQPADLPEADAAELEELQARADSEELTDSEIARIEELEERAEGDWSDEDYATGGVFLQIDRDGKIGFDCPFRRREDDPDAAPTDGGTATKVETRALPNNLVEDLTKIRLAALQMRAAQQSELMLDLLAYQLSGDAGPYAQALSISRTCQNIAPEKADGFEPPALFETPPDGSGQMSAEAFAAFRLKGKKHRNEVITRALARALMTFGDIAPALAGHLAPNPREIWTPTATGYFNRLPVPALDDLWAQLVPEGRQDPKVFRDAKKAEKAKLLHRLFNEADYREALGLSRDMNARLDAWLPEQLQWPSVESSEP